MLVLAVLAEVGVGVGQLDRNASTILTCMISKQVATWERQA